MSRAASVILSSLYVCNVASRSMMVGQSWYFGGDWMDSFWAIRLRSRQFFAAQQIGDIVAKHNVNITYVNLHDNCQAQFAVSNLLDMYAHSKPSPDQPSDMVVFVGPCQEGTVSTATLTSLWKITHLNYATEDVLSSKTRFPFFSRTAETTSSRFRAMADFISGLDWQLVSILREDSSEMETKSTIFKTTISDFGYSIAISAEVAGFIDNTRHLSRSSTPEFKEALLKMSDTEFHDARIVLFFTFGFQDPDWEFMKSENLLIGDPRFITIFDLLDLEPAPFGSYFILSKAADPQVWQDLCAPLIEHYYEWYIANAPMWHSLRREDAWGSAWDGGFYNSTHLNASGLPGQRWTCEGVHGNWDGVSWPLDMMGYALRSLDAMLTAGANPFDAEAWQPFIREQPVFNGLTGSFTIDSAGDRESDTQLCYLPDGKPRQIEYFTCCKERSGDSIMDLEACQFPLSNGSISSKPPPAQLAPETPETPAASRDGKTGETVLYFSGQGTRSLPLLAATIIIRDGSTIIQTVRISDSAELIAGSFQPSGLENKQYTAVLTIETAAGLSDESDPASFTYFAAFTSCVDYDCLGDYGVCNAATGICACPEETVLAAMAGQDTEDTEALMQQAFEQNGYVVTDAWKTCVLSIASKAEQREFWTISLWLSAWGLLSSLLILWEFVFNVQVKYPNTMMQAFISFAVPDFVLAVVNFVVFTIQLVNGDSLGSVDGKSGYSASGCIAVAFIMYFVVVCTYFAPVMVSLFTFLKFNSVGQGKAAFAVATPIVLAACLGSPALLGLALAAATYTTTADDGESVLGSYRGLYCFIRRWEPPVTMAVVVLFIVAVFMTVAMYVLAIIKVSAIVKSSGSAASKAPRAIMKRGVYMTANFVFWWIWFVVAAATAATGNTLSIQADYVGAILINAQPIVDAVVIMQMPNVRQDFLERHLKKLGIAATASSSSS